MGGFDVILAAPRGFCAGVDRAIEIVERALALHGVPVYVRHEIVHNRHVVEGLRAKGAIFVEEIGEIPAGSVVVFSAHGVSRKVVEEAGERGLRRIDATCPLVTKVHREASDQERKGCHLILIGHAGHAEVEGTMGRVPEGTITLVQTVEDVERLDLEPTTQLAFVTQTTLSVDDTRDIIAALRRRFPGIVGPGSDDICYATQNRQNAVKALAERCALILVLGAPHSSNSSRLAEVACEAGVDAHLLESAEELDVAWLNGVETVGVTSGASVPESLVDSLIARLRVLGARSVRTHEITSERVQFTLPNELTTA